MNARVGMKLSEIVEQSFLSEIRFLDPSKSNNNFKSIGEDANTEFNQSTDTSLVNRFMSSIDHRPYLEIIDFGAWHAVNLHKFSE